MLGFFVQTASVNITDMITLSFEQIVTDTLGAIAAIAPIGITIFGALMAWTYGKKFFKIIAK